MDCPNCGNEEPIISIDVIETTLGGIDVLHCPVCKEDFIDEEERGG